MVAAGKHRGKGFANVPAPAPGGPSHPPTTGLAKDTLFAYTQEIEFVEAPLFTELLGDYLEDDDYQRLQLALALNPETGDVMPGTGGCRKLRWVDRKRRKGKRGGLRVIYYYLVKDVQIWLLTLYDKDEAVDLTAQEKRLLKAAVEDEARRRSRSRGGS